ncbi:MAG: hypothetical protein WCG93_13195 [Paludibacter sp.]
MDGWIKLHRQIRDNWIWKDPVKFQWWIDILMMVNHADKKVNIGFELYECKRGQSILSLKSWGERWGVSKDTVRNFFVLLSKDNMIICENLQKSTRITICNYDAYQGDLHTEQTQSKRLTNAKQTQAHPNKNDKNEKEQINNEKEEREITLPQIFKKFLLDISEIEDYLITDEQWKEIVCMQNQIQIAELDIKIRDFSELLKLRGDKDKTPSDAKSHFVNWYNKEKQKLNTKSSIKNESSDAIKQSIAADVARIAAEQRN